MTDLQNLTVNAPGRTLSAEYLHELRTPLNQILGYSEMLTEQAQEEGQAGFLPDLEKIHTAGKQLLALLSNGASFLPDAAVRESAPAPDTLLPELRSHALAELSTADAAQALILVVEDNEVNRDILSRRLKRQGYRVAMAEDGCEAMTAVRSQPFDMILLDIMMPQMDGYTVLQQLKADEALRHIPVIMISALDDLESVARCIEMGAEDYLPKPFEPILLKARIGASLEKKRSHDREVRLYEQLQQNYKRLQDLEKLRDDLTNMIVHDLRTPLTSVIAGMRTLEAASDLDELQREMAGIAIGGGEMLLGMINDLLDVEKLESGSMQLEYTVLDAAELVAGASCQVTSLCESKSLTLIRQIESDLPPFRGDAEKLRRTLVNLLGNAIKFTPAGGTLTVGCRFGENRESLVFSVRDTGEGIPREAFARIFEKFGQVESRRGGRTMSTGLGLTFCKLTVEAHGGQISVESAPGEGSTFSFTIPLTSDGGGQRM